MLLAGDKTVSNEEMDIIVKTILDYVFGETPYKIQSTERLRTCLEVVVEYHRRGFMFEDEIQIPFGAFFDKNPIYVYEESVIQRQIDDQEATIHGAQRAIVNLNNDLRKLKERFNVD
ncbi:hypothetical protein [Stenotrophomonas phage YB07]|uniref:Uncharacterized protein n=1 Tax=Stenotrophomonas phage YB07 TaxID=2555548 RepID=A0A482IHZ5_9CAUD|nr:hypothetical protein HWC11_gp175 [Stenotrophomonas phage YB07]QBP06371.1 hypothetical protein [Stenotrophomonas phage YB07]